MATRLVGIGDTLTQVFAAADLDGVTPQAAADRIASERIAAACIERAPVNARLARLHAFDEARDPQAASRAVNTIMPAVDRPQRHVLHLRGERRRASPSLM